jgi:hypothetical protein
MRYPARPFEVALAATLHDPPGALAEPLTRALPRLAALYASVAVATSPPTSARIVRSLANAGMWAGTVPSNRRGPLYRLSVRRALVSGAARVHYCDLDRVLHWLVRAPRELVAVLRLAGRHRALVLGRTAKAHRSHHVPLWATETLVNRLLAERGGLVRPIDLLVPSFVVEREAAAYLLARSRARDATVYGEWAALLLAAGDEIAYLECRGLDWETPDRHRRAVRRVGFAAWRRRQDTPAEWALRVAMAADFLRGFTGAHARAGSPVPTVRRLSPRPETHLSGREGTRGWGVPSPRDRRAAAGKSQRGRRGTHESARSRA